MKYGFDFNKYLKKLIDKQVLGNAQTKLKILLTKTKSSRLRL